MKSFQSIFTDVLSYFYNRGPATTVGEPANGKRQRSDDEDKVICVDLSPPKRPKLLGRRFFLNDENNPQRKSASTQTSREYQLGEEDRPSLSRIRHAYRPPQHVRSPNRRRQPRAQQLFSSTGLASHNFDSTADLTMFSARPSPRLLFATMASNDANTPATVDLTASQPTDQRTAMSLRGVTEFKDSSQKFTAMRQTRFAEHKAPSQSAYGRLLGSVISDSAREVMKVYQSRKETPVVDLTDGDDDNVNEKVPTFDLTATGASAQKAAVLSRTRLVCPNVITLDSDDDILPVRRQPRVGSFQERILNNKFMSPDLVNRGYDSYSTKVIRLLEASAQLEKQEVNQLIDDLLAKRLRAHAGITESILIEDDKEEEEDTKPPLTPQMMAKVQHAQDQSLNSNEVLVSKFKLDVRRDDFISLKNLNWLNDAIINFYLELIVERGNSDNKRPKVYAFSTFFYPAVRNGYERVRRYTRKVDLFEKEIILVPIHLSIHWCMATIDLKRKQIVYYDSMLSSNQKVLDTLMGYLVSEHKDKKKTELDVTGWSTVCDKDIPTQENGSDCGVFACTFAECASRRAKFAFSQKDMPYMRSKMCYEIFTGKLLT